jgi:nucleoside-diphosphate-sugar epimerase
MVLKPGRLLITGCNGFIGQALAQRCLAVGKPIIGSVRSESKSAGLPKGVSPVIIRDIGPRTNWSEALDGVSEIVHLAARVHALDRPNRDSQADFFRTNTDGTARLARAAAQVGVRRMVFISTVKVHGEGQEKPYSEKDREAPQGPYAVSKQAAEMALKQISDRSRLETVVLRPPLVYGPGVGANFLRLIQLVERRIPLPFKMVSNRRSMIFVGNLVDAIIACLNEPEAAGRTYLAADAESLSTPQLIARIASQLGVNACLFACPPHLLRLAGTLIRKKEEIDRLLGSLVVDMSSIQSDLEWHPIFTFNEGLSATIAWYRKAAGCVHAPRE